MNQFHRTKQNNVNLVHISNRNQMSLPNQVYFNNQFSKIQFKNITNSKISIPVQNTREQAPEPTNYDSFHNTSNNQCQLIKST